MTKNLRDPVLISPTRTPYEAVRDSTSKFLMRGSLHQTEVEQARKSLGKGGSITAKQKRRKEADDMLRKAKRAI